MPMEYQVVVHPRLKRDYKGRSVRTRVEMKNGWGIVPAGAIAVINTQGPKGSSLLFEPCTCCGLRAIVTAVQPTDIEFVVPGAATDAAVAQT